MVMETLEIYENFKIVKSRPRKWKFIKYCGEKKVMEISSMHFLRKNI